MATDRPPVCFKDYTRQKPGAGSSQPPVSIKADDLDKNFMWAGLIVDDEPPAGFSAALLTVEEKMVDGHKQRVLSLGNVTALPLYTALNGSIYEVKFHTESDPELV